MSKQYSWMTPILYERTFDINAWEKIESSFKTLARTGNKAFFAPKLEGYSVVSRMRGIVKQLPVDLEYFSEQNSGVRTPYLGEVLDVFPRNLQTLIFWSHNEDSDVLRIPLSSKLKNLSLNFDSRNEGVGEIEKWIKSLPKGLENFVVECKNVPSSSVEGLLERLPNLCSLRLENSIGEKGALAIQKACSTHKNIQYVDIGEGNSQNYYGAQNSIKQSCLRNAAIAVEYFNKACDNESSWTQEEVQDAMERRPSIRFLAQERTSAFPSPSDTFNQELVNSAIVRIESMAKNFQIEEVPLVQEVPLAQEADTREQFFYRTAAAITVFAVGWLCFSGSDAEVKIVPATVKSMPVKALDSNLPSVPVHTRPLAKGRNAPLVTKKPSLMR